MFFFHIIELRISNNFSISIFTFLHFYKCYTRIFYCNSRTGMIQFIRLTECSARGSALVLRSEFVMTKTRLRGSPCSGLRGSQGGSTGQIRPQGRILSVCRSSGMVYAALHMPIFYACGRRKEKIWRVCT